MSKDIRCQLSSHTQKDHYVLLGVCEPNPNTIFTLALHFILVEKKMSLLACLLLARLPSRSRKHLGNIYLRAPSKCYSLPAATCQGIVLSKTLLLLKIDLLVNDYNPIQSNTNVLRSFSERLQSILTQMFLDVLNVAYA